MSIYQETFEGSTIEITDDDRLTINEKEIEYEHTLENQKWSSRYLPYTQYDSLIDLAQAIVRDTSEFTPANPH